MPAAVRVSPGFARLCPETAQVMVKELAPTPVVVFACVHNAGRSQIAAAFFNTLADPAKAHAISAGTQPADHVHPEVVETMREVGIDLNTARPQRLTAALATGAQLMVTMGCSEECPVVPGLRRDDWALPDPKGQTVAKVRAIRDEIRRRVTELVDMNGWRAQK